MVREVSHLIRPFYNALVVVAPFETNMVHRIPTKEKQAVALTSVVAAVLLITMKLTVGLWTGSLGIISEAMHSGLDLVAGGGDVFFRPHVGQTRRPGPPVRPRKNRIPLRVR